MMYAAQIDERNIVVDVIVVGDEHGIAWCQSNLSGQWIETSSTIRGKFAAKGDTYNATLDEFIAPDVMDRIQ
jgi:hypothetical protein